MNASIKIGFAATLFALCMTAAPAHAEALPGYACDEVALGVYQRTLETTTEGVYVYQYVCTEFDWQIYDVTFCDFEGNCSSN